MSEQNAMTGNAGGRGEGRRESGRESGHARLLMAKCSPRKMRFLGIFSHYRASRGVSTVLLPATRYARETHADKRRDGSNAEHIRRHERTDTNRGFGRVGADTTAHQVSMPFSMV